MCCDMTGSLLQRVVGKGSEMVMILLRSERQGNSHERGGKSIQAERTAAGTKVAK